MSYNQIAATVSCRTNRVLLIYTGGTIGMGQNPKTHALEPLDFTQLSMQMPEFAAIETGIDVYQFTPPIDSSDMTPRLWAQLSRIIAERYDSYDGFVILHGTDTMAYTASALSFLLENLTKPVILTGSQLPIGQLRTDGKENLITSIEIAAAHHDNGLPIVPEVCIYFSGKLLRGNRSTKINADGFNAFESFNYPHLADAGIHIVYHEENIMKPDFSLPMTPHFTTDPNVVVFTLFQTSGEEGWGSLNSTTGFCWPDSNEPADNRHAMNKTNFFISVNVTNYFLRSFSFASLINAFSSVSCSSFFHGRKARLTAINFLPSFGY